MEPFDKFEKELHEVLDHLKNPLKYPLHKPPVTICQVLGYATAQDVGVLRGSIKQAIEGMKPDPDVPTDSPGWLPYHILSYYLQGLTREVTAEKLGYSTRQIQRKLSPAIQLLAKRLWQKSQSAERGGDLLAEADSLQSQLDVLPGENKANLAETIDSVVKTGEVLTSTYGLDLRVEPLSSDIAVAIHRSALRQILLTAIKELVPHVESGEIVITGQVVSDQVVLIIRGKVGSQTALPQNDLIAKILQTAKGTFIVEREDQDIVFRILLLLVKTTVLVVDDNPDYAYLFRIYTANTPYHITHLSTGEQLFEKIPAIKPDIIILDVLLPEQDGWELLSNLHNHHEARSIPVIVCSVIEEETLALALGAALYLPKSVKSQQFIEALDRVLLLASSTAP